MSRLSRELSIIPTVARVLAAIVYFGTAVGFWAMFTFGPPGNGAPPVAKFLLICFAGIPLAIYTLLIGYVNADARRRGMRYIMWTLLAIFIPNAIGMILYFILRDPLPKPCPGCGHVEKANFPFCPRCGTLLHPTCPKCDKPVDSTWANCAYCGQQLPESATRATQNPSVAT